MPKADRPTAIEIGGVQCCPVCERPANDVKANHAQCRLWRDRLPRSGQGSRMPWEVPSVLYARNRTDEAEGYRTLWSKQFEEYLAFWTDGYPEALADLEAFNPDHYAVYIATMHEGQSVTDFARQRGVSPWTAYSWRRRALLRLRRRLDREGDWEASPTEEIPA